jgi:hypothetical protein
VVEIVFTKFVALISQSFPRAFALGIRKLRTPKRQPLCADCFYAHVQYAAKARLAISCTYGGPMRPMKLDVLHCTNYREICRKPVASDLSARSRQWSSALVEHQSAGCSTEFGWRSRFSTAIERRSRRGFSR